MDKLDAMRVFTKVVASGSFAEAARQLGLTRSAVSKGVIELEQILGARLLDRTTRKVSVTEAGIAYYERCLAILADIEETELQVSRLHDEPKGTLKLNAPMSFGILHVGRAVADFMVEYPDVKIELSLNDRFVDPIEEGFDVTIRIASSSESAFVRTYMPFPPTASRRGTTSSGCTMIAWTDLPASRIFRYMSCHRGCPPSGTCGSGVHSTASSDSIERSRSRCTMHWWPSR